MLIKIKTIELQYRLLRDNRGFYPQVRKKKFVFWGFWQRISRGIDNDFNLYSDVFRFPLTKIDAENLIEEFDKWFKSKEKNRGKITIYSSKEINGKRYFV